MAQALFKEVVVDRRRLVFSLEPINNQIEFGCMISFGNVRSSKYSLTHHL